MRVLCFSKERIHLAVNQDLVSWPSPSKPDFSGEFLSVCRVYSVGSAFLCPAPPPSPSARTNSPKKSKPDFSGEFLSVCRVYSVGSAFLCPAPPPSPSARTNSPKKSKPDFSGEFLSVCRVYSVGSAFLFIPSLFVIILHVLIEVFVRFTVPFTICIFSRI